MKNFNKLSPAETERLSCLSEECGEVVQAIGKILRHGYESYHPQRPGTSNRIDLARELGHVQRCINMLNASGDIDSVVLRHSAEATGTSKYLHHQIKPCKS